jgi:beta-mannosidase
MKKFLITLLFIQIVQYGLTQTSTMIKTSSDLQLSWQFRQSDGSVWMPATVPGCVHTDLIENKKIEHPFFGTAEADCQWVGEKDWIYETSPFDVADSILEKSVVRMKFKGLDTYADVYLNEKKIFSGDNAFRSWELDVRKLLKKAGNVLRIYFHSPLPIAEERLKALPYPLPGAGERAVVRKPQFHYGWDFGPKLITCGITKAIEIIAYDDARFTDIYIEQLKVTEKLAQLKTTFTIHSDKDWSGNIVFEMTKNGDNWTTDVHLKRGMNIVELPFEIEYPYRWWCNDQGVPNLYEFSIVLRNGDRIVDSRIERTGIRDIKMITAKDSIGESFYFSLNDKPVFIKGANYIPVKYFPGEATETDYRTLISNCKNAHINMLRVWGGGVYEDDLFYKLCDENGIMVWQDFMFACSMYPADSVFISGLIEEVNEQTIRLRNHPCMALWCGNNEIAEGWENWGWQQGLNDSQKARIWRAYKDVFDLTLGKAVKKNTNLQYWESSPLFGRRDPRSLTQGDSHYWGLWHDEEPFESLKKNIPRFMSEFGMQSFPSEAVLKEMMKGDVLNYEDTGMKQHQKHDRGFKLMDQYMARWYPKISHDNLIDYAAMTQVVQAEGIALGIEAQRRAAPYCMGTMYWQLNDVWPAFSWSGIDYKGNPKLLHDYLQTVYAPKLISCVVEKDMLNVYWICDNDLLEDSLKLRISIFDENNLESPAIAIDDKRSSLFTLKESVVQVRSGTYIIASIPLKNLSFKSDLENKIIEATLSPLDIATPRYKRIQKILPDSSHGVIPVRYSYPTYEPKSKKRKENIGIRYEKRK